MEFTKVIVTRKGENILDWVKRNDGVARVEPKTFVFPATTQQEIDSIISHPAFAGWKYGISVGVANV